jgi:iron complex outermembrane receptor protein
MKLRTRADFNHRDKAFTTDDNKSYQNAFDSLDASITLEINPHASVSVYGRNLTNHAFQGLVVLIPASLVPPITSGRQPNVGWLSEGRVIGGSVKLTF